KMIDARTSLVVCEGTRLRDRIGACLSGISGPTVLSTATGCGEALPSHLRTYRRDPTSRQIPGLVQLLDLSGSVTGANCGRRSGRGVVHPTAAAAWLTDGRHVPARSFTTTC